MFPWFKPTGLWHFVMATLGDSLCGCIKSPVTCQHGKSKVQGDWDTGQVHLGGQICSVDAALGLGLHHAAAPATLLLGRALCKELPGGTGISGDTIAASRDPAQWGATSQPRRLV